LSYLGTYLRRHLSCDPSRDSSTSPPCSGEHFSCCSCPLSLCCDKHLGILERNRGAVSSPGLRKHPQTILIDIVASRTGVEIFPEPARSQTSRTLLPFDRTLGMLDLYPEMRLRHRQHRSRAWPQVPYHSTSLGNIDSSGVLPVSYQDPRPRINLCMCWRCNA
jgi:hypothetical protein